MKKLLSITLLLSVPLLNIFAQEISQDSLLRLLNNASKSYANYNKIKNLESRYLSSSYKDNYLQTIAVCNSFWGNYKESIDLMPWRWVSYPQLDTSEFNKFTPYTAEKIIDSLITSNQIIVFNEAHNMPIHRVVVNNYLDLFYKKGFRYIAVEGLSDRDTLLNTRKYPIQDLTGYYINEPCYGDFIRAALKLGYILVPYDFKSMDITEREKGQANNIIKKILKPNPNAKILIYCGFSHGLDLPPDAYSNIAMMGYYLKDGSGIDPLVINQQQLTESINSTYERTDYYYAMKKYDIQKPTIFLSETKKIWKWFNSTGDIALFIPRTTYFNGRPTWLTMNGKKKYYFPNIEGVDDSSKFLVQAFIAAEGEQAVPLDQVEYKKPSSKALILYEGNYIIKYIDTNGNVIKKDTIKIQ